jgi:hypothetical protein
MTEKGLSLPLISRNDVHIVLKPCISGVVERASIQTCSRIIPGEVSDSALKSCTSGVFEGALIQSSRIIPGEVTDSALKSCTSGVVEGALIQSSRIIPGEVSDSALKSCTSGVVEGALIQTSRIIPGEVSEWLKEHAWKVCIGQKLIAGSNPALSAKQKPMPRKGHFSFAG